ncbi:hypothetical protein HGA34_04555 [Candidatus Falkowbacteria bacterium]|nr:hypothetical protein [Candidatus Falkowbacteria bacterium]
MERLDNDQLRTVMALSLAGGNRSKAAQAEAILIIREQDQQDQQGGGK